MLSTISHFKKLAALVFFLTMLSSGLEGVYWSDDGLTQTSEYADSESAEKESEKKESEKKEKESESEEYLLANLNREKLNDLRIISLYSIYQSRWCNPELEIITPPPEA